MRIDAGVPQAYAADVHGGNPRLAGGSGATRVVTSACLFAARTFPLASILVSPIFSTTSSDFLPQNPSKVTADRH